MKNIPLLSGLVYLIRITPQRGSSVLGSLELGGEIMFESVFPTYKDAYWALMEMDSNDYLTTVSK